MAILTFFPEDREILKEELFEETFKLSSELKKKFCCFTR